MSELLDRFKEMVRPHPGWAAIAAALALSVVGIVAIGGTAEPFYAAVQMQWLVIALIVMVLCTIPTPRNICDATYPLMGLTLLFLLFVILPFVPSSIVPVRNGARSWINFRFMSFQPSEMAKIVFILALARYMRWRRSYRTLRGLLVPFAIMFVPVLLILKEPDLGSALLFPPVLFAVLVAAGAKLRHLSALAMLAILAVVLNIVIIYKLPDNMQVLKPHQRDRIKAMISQAQGDDRYIRDIGYQQDKSMTLIGSGSVTGYGASRSATIVRFNKLPEDHNDMIFAVIVNRWGFAGGAGVLGLYLVLLGSFGLVAARSKDPFARLATIGFGAMLFAQMTINIGVTVGLIPVTGITLPFVSYGGTSLVTVFAMVGLVINFASRRPALITRPSFEFDPMDAAYE